MKHFLALNKVPYLFCFLSLALIALMAFQISWLTMSKNLIEEQFDQKVNLAIGSALTDFNSSHKTSIGTEEIESCITEDDLKYLPIQQGILELEDQVELEESLSAYMAYYGIEEKYSVDIFSESCRPSKSSYCCSLGPMVGCNEEYVLGVSFSAKNKYMYDQMSPMILSSVLIFFLLAFVSYLTLWALVRQKKITSNNIDFFNNTAHELKTPLTNISLALKLLELKHEGIQGDQYAKIIKAENTKLSDQIERVLFLSKMESGEYELKKEKLDLKSLIKGVVENMALMLQAHNGEVKINMPDEDLKILGDHDHLSNVIKNLIDNAIKYCDKDPVIRINVSQDDTNVKLEVADNGIGISEEDQCHIFEKFQRVNTGNIRRAKGFGIGLSYVKTVIEMHKGLVKVKSELNRGSKFQLFIPNIHV